MKPIIEIFDEYLDKFLVTKKLQQINFYKILKEFKISLLDIDIFIGSSYFFNIEAELFNINNNLNFIDVQEAYSGFSKFELKRYKYILEYFVFEINKYRTELYNNKNNYCPKILISGNDFVSNLPSEIDKISELYLYDTKYNFLYQFSSNSNAISLFNLEVINYTQAVKYKLNVPYYTLNKIIQGESWISGFPQSTSVSNFLLNKYMVIIKIVCL